MARTIFRRVCSLYVKSARVTAQAIDRVRGTGGFLCGRSRERIFIQGKYFIAFSSSCVCRDLSEADVLSGACLNMLKRGPSTLLHGAQFSADLHVFHPTCEPELETFFSVLYLLAFSRQH